MRQLVLVSGTWLWKVGRGSVRIKNPAGKSFYASAAKVVGVDENTWERGQWKRTSDGMVTPGRVRAYIEETRMEQ